MEVLAGTASPVPLSFKGLVTSMMILLGDLAVRVEQEKVHSVDYGVFDLQPEVRGVVRLVAEDLLVGEVGHRRGGLDGFQDCLAAPRAAIPPRNTAVCVSDLLTALYGHVYHGAWNRLDADEE